MELYNRHQEQLIRAIEMQIQAIDRECEELSQQIYFYSEERVEELEKQIQEQIRERQTQEELKNREYKELTRMKKQYEEIEKEKQAVQAHLEEMEMIQEANQKRLIFIEEKTQQQQPFIKPLQEEKAKTTKMKGKIKYAKQKLNTLQEQIRRQQQETEYTERMVKLMKEQLYSHRQSRGHESVIKRSKQTTASYVSGSNQTQRLTALAKHTEFSQQESGSMISTFRE